MAAEAGPAGLDFGSAKLSSMTTFWHLVKRALVIVAYDQPRSEGLGCPEPKYSAEPAQVAGARVAPISIRFVQPLRTDHKSSATVSMKFSDRC